MHPPALWHLPTILPARYWLCNATVPPALFTGVADTPDTPQAPHKSHATLHTTPQLSLLVEGGHITALQPQARGDAPRFELDGALLFPAFVDPHCHLDKGDLLAAGLAPEQELHAAIDAVRNDYARWTRSELEARIGFALRTAQAHGTRHLLTYADWPGGAVPLAWQVLCEQRQAWAGRVGLTLASLAALDLFDDTAEAERLGRELAAASGVLGLFVPAACDLETLLPRALDLAERLNLCLDFHIDEHTTAAHSHLRSVARAVHERGLGTRTVFGHGCALAVLPPAELDATLDAMAACGAGLVALPHTNLYLQDSTPQLPRRTPRQRGLAPLHEAQRRGIPLALGADNHRDPFFPGGDLDPLQTLALGALAAQLDDAALRWSALVTTAPARMLGLAWDGILKPGAPADLVLHPARNSAEWLARPGWGRRVIRSGQLLDTAAATLPHWRELDGLRAARLSKASA